MNYIQNLLMKNMDKCTIIPVNICETRSYTFSFEGWKIKFLSIEDSELNDAIIMASASIDKLIEIYGNTHAFTQPILSISPNGIMTVKIGTMEIEIYNERMEKIYKI